MLLLSGFVSAVGQEVGGTKTSETDSLQELRILELEQQVKRLQYQMQELSREQDRQTDSLLLMWKQQTTLLEESRKTLRKTTDELNELELKHAVSMGKTQMYRQRLRQVFWLTGTSLFLLLLGAFIYLLIRQQRIRNALDHRLSVLRKYTREEIGESHRENRKYLKKRMKKIAAKLTSGKKKGKKKK